MYDSNNFLNMLILVLHFSNWIILLLETEWNLVHEWQLLLKDIQLFEFTHHQMQFNFVQMQRLENSQWFPPKSKLEIS